MNNNQKSDSQKLAINGYQPAKSNNDKFGYQPPKSQSSSGQGTPPQKP
ncbi:hypothetical protein ACN08P_17685 [Photobacterium leiognathi subsp. mandapamensis]